MLLPHHSLIAKDHVGSEAGGLLRFKLGSLLATQVTTEVIKWYFGGAAALGDYDAIANRALVHPWRLLEGLGAGDDVIGQRVRAADGTARWQDLALKGLNVLEGVS
jgi:hypothetical protein